jgi:hypothetical protein
VSVCPSLPLLELLLHSLMIHLSTRYCFETSPITLLLLDSMTRQDRVPKP